MHGRMQHGKAQANKGVDGKAVWTLRGMAQFLGG